MDFVSRSAPFVANDGGGNAMRVCLRWCLIVLAFVLAAWPGREAAAQAWLLTQAERKAYLQHYAPVIM